MEPNPKGNETTDFHECVHSKLKPLFEPPPTTNLPTGNKPRNIQSTQNIAETHKHIDGTLNHDYCLNFWPAPPSVFTPTPTIGLTTVISPTITFKPNFFVCPDKQRGNRITSCVHANTNTRTS